LKSFLIKLFPCIVQLHNLLTAEGSAKVPEEDKKQWFLFPEVPEVMSRSVRHGHPGIRGFFMIFGNRH
jgi:hypothetical protein